MTLNQFKTICEARDFALIELTKAEKTALKSYIKWLAKGFGAPEIKDIDKRLERYKHYTLPEFLAYAVTALIFKTLPDSKNIKMHTNTDVALRTQRTAIEVRIGHRILQYKTDTLFNLLIVNIKDELQHLILDAYLQKICYEEIYGNITYEN